MEGRSAPPGGLGVDLGASRLPCCVAWIFSGNPRNFSESHRKPTPLPTHSSRLIVDVVASSPVVTTFVDSVPGFPLEASAYAEGLGG